MKLHAYAKINLDLRILGLRSDGYHELRTILQTVELHDTLTFQASRRAFLLRCDADRVPADRTNLIWRAADALWTAAGRGGDPHGVTVTLDKRIPVQGGLGGGSADAAAALVGLSRMWGLRVAPGFGRARPTASAKATAVRRPASAKGYGGPPKQCEGRSFERRRKTGAAGQDVNLVDVAATLGADVPFFLCGGTALGVGRGDEIYPLAEVPRSYVALVIPRFGVATADAYAWYDEPGTPAPPRPGPPPAFDPNALDRARLRNDLAPVVEARHPVILTLRERLLKAGATVAALSGSGSAVFGLFTSEKQARAAMRRCQDLPCTRLVTHTIGRHDMRRSLPPRADVG